MGNICDCLCKKKAKPQLDLEEQDDVYASPLDMPEVDVPAKKVERPNTPNTPNILHDRDSSTSPTFPTYTPQYITTQPRVQRVQHVRRSRRLAQKRLRRRGLALDVIDAFMDPNPVNSEL